MTRKKEKIIPIKVKRERKDKIVIILYIIQILIEILAAGLSIALIYTEYAVLGKNMIMMLGGFMFIIAGVFGVATLVSIPNKSNKAYKVHVFTFALLALSAIGIAASIKNPIFGVISYSAFFILIPFQIGTVIFTHFHWKNRKGFGKFASLFTFISTIIISLWYLSTSLAVPVSLVFIKRPSLEHSKKECIIAATKIDSTWQKRWDAEPKESKATFKIDDKTTNIYEWAPKADPIKKHDDLVLFVHGLNGTRYTAMRYMQTFYDDIKNPKTNKGYKMLSFDMRGFGANREMHRTYALKEADDLNNAFNAVIKEYQPAHLIIYGISNGAATTISFATKYQGNIKSKNTDVQLIEESGYTSPQDELESMTDQFKFPHQMMMPQAFPLYRVLTGTFWGERSYIDEINNVEQPLMILHGGKDYIVPQSMGRRLWAKRQSGNMKKTSALFMKNVGHVKIGREHLSEFAIHINKFLTGKQYGKTEL